MITLFPDQEDLYQSIRYKIGNGCKRLAVQSATGSGKCLGKDTPILMFDGSIKMSQNVSVGDKLMGPDSNAREVTSICSGKENLYRIIPIKGSDAFICNESHILSLRRTGNKTLLNHPQYETRSKKKGHITNISVKDYLIKSKTFKHISKLWRCEIDFKNDLILPVDPYFLGIWLGDGNSNSTAITSMDKEIVSVVYEAAAKFNLSVKIQKGCGRALNYHITKGRQCINKNRLLEKLKKINVIKNKHIPLIYKTASKPDRLAILAGLIDTDGSLQGGCFDYISKLKILADDVCFVARSVGLSAQVKTVEKQCVNNGVWETYYRVSISGNTDIVPTRILRKKAEKRLQKKDPMVSGFDIEYVGIGDYYGFEIEGQDRLFLLGDFTVTHNTIVSSKIVHGAFTKGSTAHFIVPRKELLKQTSKTFDKFDIDHGHIAAGYPEYHKKKIFVCSKDTLLNRIGKFEIPKLVIADECHFGGKGLDDLIQMYTKAGAILLGLSATPKPPKPGMERQYDDMVCGKSIRWLIDNKRLSEYKLFSPDIPDLSDIRKIAGEYNQHQLQEKMEGDKVLIGSSVEHYKKYAMGKLGITFAVGIKHSEILAQAYRDAGIPAMHMDGNTPEHERTRIIKAFARRELLQLCNAELLGFGFDLNSASGMDVCIETMTDCQPTMSLEKQLQKWGRVLRYKPEPALIFDHAGNSMKSANEPKHGFPCWEREWDIAPIKKKNGESHEKMIAIKRCPVCHFCFRPKPVCPNCHHVLPVDSRTIKQVAGELKELQVQQQKKERQSKAYEEYQCENLKDWLELAKKRGHAPGWAYMRNKTAKPRVKHVE